VVADIVFNLHLYAGFEGVDGSHSARYRQAALSVAGLHGPSAAFGAMVAALVVMLSSFS
jgi:hypothetical protein